MTNLEKLRNGDIRELAFWLMCPHGGTGTDCHASKDCIECTVEWLNEEADE